MVFFLFSLSAAAGKQQYVFPEQLGVCRIQSGKQNADAHIFFLQISQDSIKLFIKDTLPPVSKNEEAPASESVSMMENQRSAGRSLTLLSPCRQGGQK